MHVMEDIASSLELFQQAPEGSASLATSDACPSRIQLGQYTHLLKYLLSQKEGDDLITSAESLGFARHPSNTRDQILFSCPLLSDQVASRLSVWVPSELQGRRDGQQAGHAWNFVGLSKIWRLTRYNGPGDELGSHFDAVKCEGDSCCSVFTITVYLNTVSEEQGGRTKFDAKGSITPIGCEYLHPAIGSALLLDHGVLHSGEALRSGTKYILRTEVLYSSDNAPVDEVDGIGDLHDYEMEWPSATIAASNRASSARISLNAEVMERLL